MGDHGMRTHEWAMASKGALTDTQKRVVAKAIRAGYLDVARGYARWPFQRSRTAVDLPTPPDSALARTAEEAALDQGPMLAGHGHRTWLAGVALADHDGNTVDRELLYVAALLHDAGMVREVVGEDFTIRSADAVIDVSERSGRGDVSTTLADAVVAHTTPGLDPAVEPLGYYVQVGALADLAGLRLWDLPPRYLRNAYAAHPPCDIHRGIAELIRIEAHNVPDGRFAILERYGLARMVSLSPSRFVARSARHERPDGQ